MNKFYMTDVLFLLESTNLLLSFAALLVWYNFAARIRMLLSFCSSCSLGFASVSHGKLYQSFPTFDWAPWQILSYDCIFRFPRIKALLGLVCVRLIACVSVPDVCEIPYSNHDHSILLLFYYTVIILSYNCRFLLPAATPPCVWAVRLVGCFKMITSRKEVTADSCHMKELPCNV
jgi:hypothetical protein